MGNLVDTAVDDPILMAEATDFLRQLRREAPAALASASRLAEIRGEIAARGAYRQTYAELAHGAKQAWRNSTHCVGRHYWQTLAVRDCRHLKDAGDIFAALVEHLRLSTNGGRIRPTISVFAPHTREAAGPRIWNEQLIRYAGYRLPDGTLLGDPRQLDFTLAVLRLGWRGAAGTPFDVLPLVVEVPPAPPRLFDVPRDAVLEVAIHHPDYPWFAELGLRWHALPAISNMLLDAGGIRYPAAPFSGWYMGAEIAARNLADAHRYNQLPIVARRMGLDTRREDSLWRDRALVELNVAVLHSFRQAGVKMVDHHTATRHFVCFEEREQAQGRPTYADWAWMVPPLSGSTTPVYHRPYQDVALKPNFFPQPEPWRQGLRQAAPAGCPFAAR
jgi:nitric-oxide synthase